MYKCAKRFWAGTSRRIIRGIPISSNNGNETFHRPLTTSCLLVQAWRQTWVVTVRAVFANMETKARQTKPWFFASCVDEEGLIGWCMLLITMNRESIDCNEWIESWIPFFVLTQAACHENPRMRSNRDSLLIVRWAKRLLACRSRQNARAHQVTSADLFLGGSGALFLYLVIRSRRGRADASSWPWRPSCTTGGSQMERNILMVKHCPHLPE